MSAGLGSDYTEATTLLDSLSSAGWLVIDKDYDADSLRNA